MGVKILTTSDSVTVRGSTNSSSYVVPVTTILAFKPNANSFTVYRNSNYSGYLIRYFNISSDLTDLYLADQTYLGGGQGGFNLDGGSYTNVDTNAYYYNGTTLASAGFSAPFSSTSVSGRSYYFCSANFNDSWDYEIYVGVNVSGTTYVNGEPLVTYQWQSVPSISGKNGILSLAQIKEEYINDGESVSGASADHFTNLSTENRVDVLIDDSLPAPEIGGTTVTVKYTISSLSIGSYAYCKLVAKKNSIPESPEDGDKIVDVDPSSTSIVVRGLDELSTYYFVIFIEDDQGNTASSEPKSCETGADDQTFTNKPLKELLKTLDFSHAIDGKAITTPGITDINDISSDYYGSDYVLNVGQKNSVFPSWDSTNEKITLPNPTTEFYIEGYSYIPIMHITCTNIKFNIAYYDYWNINIKFCKVENSEVVVTQQIVNFSGSGVDPGNYRTASVNLNCECEADYIMINYGDGRNPNTTMIDISNIKLSGHY